jgi:hypothetical protein
VSASSTDANLITHRGRGREEKKAYLADACERVLDLHHLADVLGLEVVLVQMLGHGIDLAGASSSGQPRPRVMNLRVRALQTCTYLVESSPEVFEVVMSLGCVFD